MRINKFVALASGLSRRSADAIIASDRVRVNNQAVLLGQTVSDADIVSLDGNIISLPEKTTVIMLNKPVGFVCSRNGQGSQTIYDLLPAQYHPLKTVGRLDKDSSGLILLTNDGQLANELTHPSYAKQKVYQVSLNKSLTDDDKIKIKRGVPVENYMSNLDILDSGHGRLQVTMRQGHNRQIRRTFSALGYTIVALHRIKFGDYMLNNLAAGGYKIISNDGQENSHSSTAIK